MFNWRVGARFIVLANGGTGAMNCAPTTRRRFALTKCSSSSADGQGHPAGRTIK